MKLEVRKVGNSYGVILPRQILDKLNVKEGDSLTLAENELGVTLTSYDPQFELAMDAFERFASKYKNALRELAK